VKDANARRHNMVAQIKVDLQWRTDSTPRKQKYMSGVLQMPANLDLKDGFVFLIWPNDHKPQLAIKPLDPNRKFRDDRNRGVSDESWEKYEEDSRCD